MTVRIINGDCRAVLAELPAESAQCCVTSPPYFGLRSYGIGAEHGELGLETKPEEYVATMVDVFESVRRVLKPDPPIQSAALNPPRPTRRPPQGDVSSPVPLGSFLNTTTEPMFRGPHLDNEKPTGRGVAYVEHRVAFSQQIVA